jgi:hypothetical protein
MLEPMGSVPYDGTRTLITFTMRRSTAIAIAVSLLVHLLALVWVVHKTLTPGEVPPSRSGPLVARLQPRTPPGPAQPATPAAQPEPPAAITPPRPAPPREPQPRRNPVITQPRPTPRAAPPAVFPPPPLSPPDNNPDTDMSANLRKRQAEQGRDGGPGTAGSAPPGDKGLETALNNFNSLTKPGISGIFTITHMGTREGEFTFNGWTGSQRNAKREAFTVDAGLNGNLERAMVREMIKLIRRHYSGDFNFDSRRLGIVKVLSARPQDSAELEEFLLLEFFGKPR